MNGVLSVRAILHAGEMEELARWLCDALELPSPEIERAAGTASFALAGSGLVIEAAGEAALELSVVSLARSLERCERRGASRLGPIRELPGGRAADLRLPQGLVLRLFEASVSGGSEGLPLGVGPVHFTVGRTMPIDSRELFCALGSKRVLEACFLHRVSADLSAGATVEWWWSETARSRLDVGEVEEGRNLELVWHAHRVPHRTRVRFSVAPTGAACSRASITEGGWTRDESGLSSAFAHAENWTELLAAVEAWLLHGVALRPRRP